MARISESKPLRAPVAASAAVGSGWPRIAQILRGHLQGSPAVLVIECEAGALLDTIRGQLRGQLNEDFWVESGDALLALKQKDGLPSEARFDPDQVIYLRHAIQDAPGPLVLFGPSALTIWPQAGTVVRVRKETASFPGGPPKGTPAQSGFLLELDLQDRPRLVGGGRF